MSYCEGYLVDGDPGTNTTSCSRHDMLFSFDPTTALERDLGDHSSLSEIGWPEAISDDFQTFSITTKSMGVFYCVGVGIAGIVILVRFGLLIAGKSRQSILESAVLFVSFYIYFHPEKNSARMLTISQLAFISFSIASIIATVLAFQFVRLVNSHGRVSDISAKYGTQFLGMTWAAVGMLLLGSITSLLFVLLDHSISRRPGSEYIPPDEQHDDSSSHHEPDETHAPKGVEVDAHSESDHLTKETG